MRTVRIAVAVAAMTHSQAGDKFNDLKRSPTAPGRLHGFHRLCRLGTIGSLIVFSIDDLALLARGRLLGLFWFCGRQEGIWIVPVPANDLIRDRRWSGCNGWNDRFG